MSTHTDQPSKPARLRIEAESRLKEGSAPPTRGWPTGVSALSLLHQLAGSPDSASDALKLLHELQVHQVELDLQHEEVEATRRELSEDLARYKLLYELAPVSYFVVGAGGDIIDANRAAIDLFESPQEELCGRRIDSLLAPESRPAIQDLLKRLRAGAGRQTCRVQSAGNRTPARQLHVAASGTSGGEASLLVMTDISGQSDPRT